LICASGKGAKIDKRAIHVAEETRQICEFFEIDPFNALGEGSLVISVRPEKAESVQTALVKAGVQSFKIGEVTSLEDRISVVDESGERRLEYPEKDTYWDAYWRAIGKGWN